jgi:hypothetical protein
VCSNPEFSDWAEAVQIDFDDREVSYEELLDTFFKSHDYWLGSGKRQYMSGIFYHTEEQKRAALAAVAKRATQRRVATLVEPATDFYEVLSDFHIPSPLLPAQFFAHLCLGCALYRELKSQRGRRRLITKSGCCSGGLRSSKRSPSRTRARSSTRPWPRGSTPARAAH